MGFIQNIKDCWKRAVDNVRSKNDPRAYLFSRDENIPLSGLDYPFCKKPLESLGTLVPREKRTVMGIKQELTTPVLLVFQVQDEHKNTPDAELVYFDFFERQKHQNAIIGQSAKNLSFDNPLWEKFGAIAGDSRDLDGWLEVFSDCPENADEMVNLYRNIGAVRRGLYYGTKYVNNYPSLQHNAI